MNSRWLWIGLALASQFLGACDPDDPCDVGFYADHGYCYLTDPKSVLGRPDASVSDDGGEPASDPNATFGKPCSVQSDCGGVAPVCGGKELPVCTAINCMVSGQDTCPDGWVCVDITKYNPEPGVTSACINF